MGSHLYVMFSVRLLYLCDTANTRGGPTRVAIFKLNQCPKNLEGCSKLGTIEEVACFYARS